MACSSSHVFFFLFFQVSIEGIFQIIFILLSIDSIIGMLLITTDSVSQYLKAFTVIHLRWKPTIWRYQGQENQTSVWMYTVYNTTALNYKYPI